MSEMERLDKALREFSTAMIVRLKQKEEEGYTGWDDPTLSNDNLINRMMEKVHKVADAIMLDEEPDQKLLVDSANFAMFLYHRFKK